MLLHFSDLLCDMIHFDSKILYEFDHIVHIITLLAHKNENDYMYFEEIATLNINLGISCKRTKFKMKHLRTFVHSQIIECDKYVQMEDYKPEHVESVSITL